MRDAGSITTLPGGLRVVTATMPHRASVALGIWVGVGGRHEPQRLNGVSHFLEHLLFKGTKRRTAAQISQEVEGAGGYLNAFTDEEHTCFYARAPASRWQELLDVLLDMYLGSALPALEIRRERGVIQEEIAMYQDQPGEHVHDLLNEIQFGDHPLGRPVIGTTKSVAQITQRDLDSYFQTRYVAGTTVIAAAGQIDHTDLVRALKRRARHFRGGPTSKFVSAPPVHDEPRIKFHRKSTEQTHLNLAWRTVSRGDHRRYALRLLNVVLGENMSSRLFQAVREEHGLAYNIQSSISFWADTGDIVISGGLKHRDLGAAIRLILRELRRLAEHPISKAEFQRARDYVIGQMDMSLESTENQMMAAGEQILGFGRRITPEAIRKELAAVRPHQLQALAREFFLPHRCSVAAIGPDPDSPSIRKQLQRASSC